MANSDERRRYFRIDDRVDIAYQVLEEHDNVQHPIASSPMKSAHLMQVEGEIRQMLDKLKVKEPEVADLLVLFNQKLNMLYNLTHKEARGTDKQSQTVNISACGIAFAAGEELSAGTQLLLELRLFPEMVDLKLEATVIDTQRIRQPDEGRYLIRADFNNLEENQQELLIQHVLKCQTRQLKELRELRERNSES